MRALRQRIRQQEILAELGVKALQGASFDQLLTDTARLTAEGLHTNFCKILEYLPSENRLLLRAGVGWSPGLVGVATVGADLASPSGFALRTGKPVISNHLEHEQRFRTPELLQEHGIRRAMNVILQGNGRPFGVLEVDSQSGDDFVEHDLVFLQGAANILGMAIQRDRHEQKLKAALKKHKVLLKEMNHRVNNSLALVASMLHLQANNSEDERLTQQLDEASNRVTAVAKAHELLYRASDVERLDVGKYIEVVCKHLGETVTRCAIQTDLREGIVIPTARAISAALIVNELVTNAEKYAYQGQSGGKVWVTVASAGDDNFSLSVRDEGVGVPENFDLRKPSGLGMQIVKLLSDQLKAAIRLREHDPGIEFVLVIPRQNPL